MIKEISMPYANNNKVQLYYEVHGPKEARETIVFAHGAGVTLCPGGSKFLNSQALIERLFSIIVDLVDRSVTNRINLQFILRVI